MMTDDLDAIQRMSIDFNAEALAVEVYRLRAEKVAIAAKNGDLGMRLVDALAEVDRLRERIHPASDLSRAVHVATGFLLWFGTRDENGNRLTADWGEPDEDGFYEPMFTRHLDTSLQDAERARIRARVDGLRVGTKYLPDENDYMRGFRDSRNETVAAVLAAIDGEET